MLDSLWFPVNSAEKPTRTGLVELHEIKTAAKNPRITPYNRLGPGRFILCFLAGFLKKLNNRWNDFNRCK
jgi:hypothetical protein